MFVERRADSDTGSVELWWAEWIETGRKEKRLISKIADEESLKPVAGAGVQERLAICWADGQTIGNIAVSSPKMLGSFPSEHGSDAILPCDFVYAGKYRHGSDRWWCRTHQRHWGTNADVSALQASKLLRCSNHNQKMSYVIDPLAISPKSHAEVGVWCSLPAAISTEMIKPRPPKVHVHVRELAGQKKAIDRDFRAVSVIYEEAFGLFGGEDITRVNITPPAAFAFVCAVERGQELGCISCSFCGYPHSDLGEFGKTPHRKHFCGNCGRDSTWSKGPIISTPLQPLHDRYAKNLKYEQPDRSINLDDYEGCSYTVWASTPAVVWSAARPQEFGIHVHIHRDRERIIDETFGEVFLRGAALDRAELIQTMISRAIV